MSDVQQMTVEQASNRATIAAMADVLAAVGGGGIIGWAEQEPVQALPPGRPVAASGVTIGHGRIRLRDSARPTQLEGPATAPREVVGHGAIRLREPAGPGTPDLTPIAAADILSALDAGA